MPESTSLTTEIVKRLLDWPFLFFVFLIAFIAVFRSQVLGLLSRGDISISWGNSTIRLRELDNSLHQEVDPIRDELESLAEQIDVLKSQIQNTDLETTSGQEGVQAVSMISDQDDDEDDIGDQEPSDFQEDELRKETVLRMMKREIGDKRWRWRRVRRLAEKAGVSELEAWNLLLTDPEIRVSRNNADELIATLNSG